VKAAAGNLAAMISDQAWSKGVPTRKVETKADVVECAGDLMEMAGIKDAPKEKIPVEVVQLGGAAVESDPKSPVVLIGDSHAIVYHEPIPGGIPANGSGLLDHLAAKLQYAPELVANMGSGINAPRITLARRKDNLAGKKCVIWCFAVRDLSESIDGWRPVPVVR
jgi:alginate O-acetyltransferase complex protein AlgJ